MYYYYSTHKQQYIPFTVAQGPGKICRISAACGATLLTREGERDHCDGGGKIKPPPPHYLKLLQKIYNDDQYISGHCRRIIYAAAARYYHHL